MPKIAFLTFTGPAHTKTAEITADKISKTSITGLFTKYKNIFPITSKSRKNSTAVNTAENDTASTAAASIKCARISRSCAVCRTCFFRGAVRFAGHCWGRTHCRARFARPACPRKCAYSTFRRVCRRANTIFTPCGRLPRRIITRILYVQPFCAASGAAAFGMPGSWRTVWPCWYSAHYRPNSQEKCRSKRV